MPKAFHQQHQLLTISVKKTVDSFGVNRHTAEIFWALLILTKNEPNHFMTHSVSSDTRKIGKWMLVFFWLALLILLTLIFNKIENQRDNPNQTPLTQTNARGMHTIILQPNRYGYYQVNGSINQHPVTFLIDTGASRVAIPLELASHLELIPGAKFSSTTANGITQTYRTQISNLQIGSIYLRDIEGALLPNMKGQYILLGMSALQKLNFSQQDKQFILRQR